ncbi:MAG TPA: DUF4232 domain-containing protein [Pseudonocardiaceae bacterium]|nr:DUF4232 domain-containing protein [Pseudonocardiaceae bacterium]
MRTKLNAIVLGTGALVAALTVVGCGAGQAATPANQQAPVQSPAAQSTGGQVVASHSTDGGTCTTANLAAKLGTKKQLPVDPQGQLGAAGTHYQISLVWTNNSPSSCTLRGFGGVDLDGPSLGQAGGPTYSLPRTGDSPATVTLAPGASAHTVISYIDPTGSNPDVTRPWKPTHLLVTPPNQTTHLNVPWTAGTPVYFDPQDGLAAASIGPVTAGA